MLTEESKQKLYSHARDDAERQRLLASFRTDGTTDATRGFFERLAFLLIIGSGSLAAAAAMVWLGSYLPASQSKSKWLLMLAVTGFLGTGLAINLSFDGKNGKHRKERLELAARRYGYPIILASGLGLGWLAHQYNEATSDLEALRLTVLRACLTSAICVASATRLNGGDDPRYHLGPDGKPY
ncbi:hypothetical protein LB533_16250 [Mesorhizobium sp. BR1-1-13]|uniref:hypothetical protein n=1 Tax=Mesorhizobium sp. BR1-1-13 TaxID=2876656 RepID=UPI001CD14FC6|nr:hypothetical protein [Mesorhizobium sp. BR1-1-13]MBZ9942644.1 hypothetical protein [Mesorhizobium sp. BR1-1-13]